MKYLLTIILVLTAGLVQAATVSLPRAKCWSWRMASVIWFLRVPAWRSQTASRCRHRRRRATTSPTPTWMVHLESLYPSLYSDPYYGHRYEDGYYSGYSRWTPTSNGPSCYPPWRNSVSEATRQPASGVRAPSRAQDCDPGQGHAGRPCGSPSAGGNTASRAGGRGGGHR